MWYPIDEHDTVHELADVPTCDIGAPAPLIVADEHRLFLAYHTRRNDGIAIIEFERPYVHMSGPPNDEAFESHPLSARGLEPYGAYTVGASSWLRRLAQMNAVHSRHDAARFDALVHYIFAFHDSTFECIAASHHATLVRADRSIIEELARMHSRPVRG